MVRRVSREPDTCGAGGVISFLMVVTPPSSGVVFPVVVVVVEDVLDVSGNCETSGDLEDMVGDSEGNTDVVPIGGW